MFTLKTIQSRYVKYEAMFTIVLPQSRCLACARSNPWAEYCKTAHRIRPPISIDAFKKGSPFIFFVFYIEACVSCPPVSLLFNAKFCLHLESKMPIQSHTELTAFTRSRQHADSLDPPTSSPFILKALSKQGKYDQYSERQVPYVPTLQCLNGGRLALI